MNARLAMVVVAAVGLTVTNGGQVLAQCAAHESSKLVASDRDGGDYFGRSVAIDGVIAAVGALHADPGAIYVYRFDGLYWLEEVRLQASDGPWDLGSSIGLSGDTVVAGYSGDDQTATNAGAAYVFHRYPDGGWHQQAKLLASDGSYGDGFGTWVAIAQRYVAAAGDKLTRLAQELGVFVKALRRLHAGWDGAAWTFPMRDGDGCIVGIRRRFPNGRKSSVVGGREGPFVPDDLPCDGPLLFPEGPTDTAALLTLGLAAVGRPSCSGGMRATHRLARGRDAVVVADGDEPGQRGAHKLASVLRLHCPTVRMIRPPAGMKDARAWVQAGATRKDIKLAIGAARVLRLKTRMVLLHGR